ncbi:MAG TPA: PDZ domain-containing protein [Gemmataceae bacterium]|nr:PDZ domain-containing protein [Gemmataceae bacterium]
MKRWSLGAALLVVCFAAPLRSDSTPPSPVKVPFDLLITKHMVVSIKVNGKGPFKVIFDTGAPVTLLSNKIGKKAGLIGKGGAMSGFSLFGPVAQTEVKKLEIGALQADYVPVIVMDHPTVEVLADALQEPIEGIIGFPFFARYRMTLDYQAKELTFVPNGFKPVDIIQSMMVAIMSRDKPAARVLAPAGLWGIVVDKEKGDDEAGVTIKEVLPDSAAARAGLQAGDRLLTLDDRWTDSLADCYTAASYAKPGTEIIVKIKRNADEKELTVKPNDGL